mgnify:CR=1 FL=1
MLEPKTETTIHPNGIGAKAARYIGKSVQLVFEYGFNIDLYFRGKFVIKPHPYVCTKIHRIDVIGLAHFGYQIV